ncbi:hypothetical protein TNCV_2463751, partial [Trichonephila clavipes]
RKQLNSETTQLASRNETTQLVSRNASRNETTQLCTAVDRLQPPSTAYSNFPQPPRTACNRLQPPATAAPPLQQNRLSTYFRIITLILGNQMQWTVLTERISRCFSYSPGGLEQLRGDFFEKFIKFEK